MSNLVIDPIVASLRAKLGATERQRTVTPSQIRLLVRMPAESMGTYLHVVQRLLRASSSASVSWTADISKTYLLINDQVYSTWRYIFQAKVGGTPFDEAVVKHIAQTIASAPVAAPKAQESTSVPLIGARRGQDDRGRGIVPSGKGLHGEARLRLGRR